MGVRRLVTRARIRLIMGLFFVAIGFAITILMAYFHRTESAVFIVEVGYGTALMASGFVLAVEGAIGDS
jgi:hypothetical protein